MGNRFGNERVLWGGMFILLGGILLRSTGAISTMFVGTALIGIGIAVGNVLLPGLIKQKYPTKAGLMTSMYSTCLCVFAGIASGISYPLTQRLSGGWKVSFLIWAILALVTIVIWIPQIHARDTNTKTVSIAENAASVWRSKLAWSVTTFMGLQSLIFYSTIAWLPAILQSHGMSSESAGWMLSLMQFASLPIAFITPILAGRYKNQRGIIVVLVAVYMLGIVGMMIGGNDKILLLSTILLGFGQGGTFSLALTFISLRSKNVSQAADLSGISQSIGYALAAIGPSLVGAIYDATQAWFIPFLIFIVCLLLKLVFGWHAGKNETVNQAIEIDRKVA
jgi:CP family cyanate transporter-like MFS transporter